MARKSGSRQQDDELGGTDSKSARTRQRILDSAAHVLSVKGYAGTRLTDVAEHAELQAPAIYYYFPSRDDLIEEVMSYGTADMRRYVRAELDRLPPGTTPLDRVLAAAEAHLRRELAASDYTTASIRNAGQIPADMRARQKAEQDKYGEIWRVLIKDASDAGQIREELDLRAARMLVMGALNWAAEWWNPRRGSLDSVVETARSLIGHGLGVK